MYIVNHFLDDDIGSIGGYDIFGPILVPDRANAPTTNAATGTGSIGAQAAMCNSIYKRKPNFVLLDFVDQGQGIAAQNALNGLS